MLQSTLLEPREPGAIPIEFQPENSVLDPEQVERICRVEHHDPFTVLGIHPLSGGGVRVNALLPETEAARVVPQDTNHPEKSMVKVHPEGLFEGVYTDASEVFPYRLRVGDSGGSSREFWDPYQFGPILTEDELRPIQEGRPGEIYRKLGAHPYSTDGVHGFRFAVWAPNARRVSVIADFNDWDGRRHAMRVRGSSGVWEIFVPGVRMNEVYKYEIKTRDGDLLKKADPLAFCSELRPRTGSVTYGIPDYDWDDGEWMQQRDASGSIDQPITTYEVHLPSWRRGEEGEMLDYREIAHQLVEYLNDMHFTHVELMPVKEHPLDASWGYQVTGYFAATRRLGDPEDFMYFVDYLHRHGYGVILDWVPGHFPRDEHGLHWFDGTHLYEHADPRRGYHPDWHTNIFNFSRDEVRSFLLGNAVFWLECYHLDGLRVDAVASMLYRDYSRDEGEWVPNKYGGREDLEAVEFIKDFNRITHERYPGILTIAEESTDWGGVTRQVHHGGLGFDFKWNMGWMHDTLQYLSKEPVHRKHHHGMLSFMLYYAFSEQFMLVLSHDEVVHGKSSLLQKMPGDDWQKFANLRLLFGFQFAHPGKSLLFMGGEFAQRSEWQEDQSLDWHLLEYESHRKTRDLVRRLNRTYIETETLWRYDCDGEGFRWIDDQDRDNSVISFLRRNPQTGEHFVFVFNFTPVVREDYTVGVPVSEAYVEVLNTDDESFGGSGEINERELPPRDESLHGQEQSVSLTLPPLGMTMLRPVSQRTDDPPLESS